MKVIADSGILVSLSKINSLRIIRELFGKIYIPDTVYKEVVTDFNPIKKIGIESKRNIQAAIRDNCIIVQKTKFNHSFSRNKLGSGEKGVMNLAAKNRSSILLIDDGDARKEARELGFKNVISTSSLLQLAKNKGIIRSYSGTKFQIEQSKTFLAESNRTETKIINQYDKIIKYSSQKDTAGKNRNYFTAQQVNREAADLDKKYKAILADLIKAKNSNELIKSLKKIGYTAAHDQVTGRIVLVDQKGATVDLEKVIKDGKKQRRLPVDYKTGIDKEQLPDLEKVREKNVGKEQSFDDSENPDINKKRQAILSDCMKSKDGETLTKRLEKRGYALSLNPENRHILVVDYKGRAIDLTEILEEGKKQNKIKESLVIKKENLPNAAEIIVENLKKIEKRYENFNKDAAADRKDINSIYDKKKSTAKNGGEETRIEIDRDIELKNNDKKLERRIERFEKSKEDKMIQREKELPNGLGI